MRTAHLLALSLLGVMLLCFATAYGGAGGTGPENCCFKFYPRRVNVKYLRKYSITDGRCSKAGVVLLTEKQVRLCVNPNETWVQRTMRALDERNF